MASLLLAFFDFCPFYYLIVVFGRFFLAIKSFHREEGPSRFDHYKNTLINTLKISLPNTESDKNSGIFFILLLKTLWVLVRTASARRF